MEISAIKFEQMATAEAHLTIAVELHNRGKDYMVNDVLDIVSTFMAVPNDEIKGAKITIGNGEAELC